MSTVRSLALRATSLPHLCSCTARSGQSQACTASPLCLCSDRPVHARQQACHLLPRHACCRGRGGKLRRRRRLRRCRRSQQQETSAYLPVALLQQAQRLQPHVLLRGSSSRLAALLAGRRPCSSAPGGQAGKLGASTLTEHTYARACYAASTELLCYSGSKPGSACRSNILQTSKLYSFFFVQGGAPGPASSSSSSASAPCLRCCCFLALLPLPLPTPGRSSSTMASVLRWAHRLRSISCREGGRWEGRQHGQGPSA